VCVCVCVCVWDPAAGGAVCECAPDELNRQF
jgi:hypothetical protein